jgi:AcrR family transcriptional regulator
MTSTTKTDSPARKTPVQLDRGQILDAAQRIASREGVRALTLRRLGEELGVDHTAVYRHFADKDELIDAVVDRLLIPPPPLSMSDDWPTTAANRLRFYFDRLDLHPELAQRMVLRTDTTLSGAAHTEHILESYARMGIHAERAAELYELNEAVVVGVGLYLSLWRHEIAEGRDEPTTKRTLSLLDPERFPRVVASAPHLGRTPDEVAELVIGLLVSMAERETQQSREAQQSPANTKK